MKINATRQLPKLAIRHGLRHCEVDVDDLSAVKVAGQAELPGRQAFRTLCAKGYRHGVAFTLIPGGAELGLSTEGFRAYAAARTPALEESWR